RNKLPGRGVLTSPEAPPLRRREWRATARPAADALPSWFASQGLSFAFGPAHGDKACDADTRGPEERHGMGSENERPEGHTAILRSRASMRFKAIAVRIRISTTAPKNSEKPSAATSSGQSIAESIDELVRPMLCP